jgi:hypothetical protein
MIYGVGLLVSFFRHGTRFGMMMVMMMDEWTSDWTLD